jgi:26S proteasome regulatory subunit N9
LEQKIRIMKFLEIVFNLPKSDRVIRFSTVGKECGIPAEHVETMVMKAMALGLTKGLIDQLNEDVTITWIAPKVLENERIGVMLGKFEEWDQGV